MLKMKTQRLAAVVLAALLFSVTAAAAEKISRNEKAQALYDKALAALHESVERESLLKAIGWLEEAGRLDPGNEEIQIQLSWRYWMAGEYLPKESKEEREERLRWFEKGQAAGEKAMALNPKSVGGIYWSTVNLAAAGEMKGVLSSLMLAGTLFGNMSRVDRRDPYYLYGATRRFGSEVLIRVPTFLTSRFGFKHEYTVEDLEWNIERWPNYFDNYVFLARVHWWAGEREQALQRLEFVLGHDPVIFPEEKAENALQQKMARGLWKEWTGKDYPER